MAGDRQEAMQVWGKGVVEARGQGSISRVLPPHQEVFTLTKWWPHLKAGDGGDRRGHEAGVAEEERSNCPGPSLCCLVLQAAPV